MQACVRATSMPAGQSSGRHHDILLAWHQQARQAVLCRSQSGIRTCVSRSGCEPVAWFSLNASQVVSYRSGSHQCMASLGGGACTSRPIWCIKAALRSAMESPRVLQPASGAAKVCPGRRWRWAAVTARAILPRRPWSLWQRVSVSAAICAYSGSMAWLPKPLYCLGRNNMSVAVALGKAYMALSSLP